ncbi:hypothetical protein FGB62_18g013 [Gracilaria domingensis]|nr:hypothetical protein FGB62_18g013 [Gracilaria domingensis]
MYPRYVCLPEYKCSCHPREKAVSRTTMLKHRKAANNLRLQQGLQTELPWGPREQESMIVRAQYQSYVEQSLSDPIILRSLVAEERTDEEEELERAHNTVQHLFNEAEAQDEAQPAMANFYHMNTEALVIDAARQQGTHVEASVAGALEEVPESVEEIAQLSSNPRHSETDHLLNNESNVMQIDGMESMHEHLSVTARESACSFIDLIENHSIDSGSEVSLGSPNTGAGYFGQSQMDTGLSNTCFTTWILENKSWIEPYFRHNVTQVVMDAILKNINLPYKCWKTVVSRPHVFLQPYDCIMLYMS